ncbi:glutaminase A [Thermoleophilia bacterium SCSIO 60948]|nr:glutaminase A [Thermoleophilia bacterium SCSIO 60948]
MSPANDQVDERLGELHARHLGLGAGDVASYYSSARGSYPPQEAGSERDRFAISFAHVDGDVHPVGDFERLFLLQSISKVFAYALALADLGRDEVLSRVGVEPSGEAFNAIAFDEHTHTPFNPMVNSGAIVTSTLVRGADADEKLERILNVVRSLAANPTIDVDEEAARDELAISDHNRAVAYLMRSEGMLEGDVEENLRLYLRQCSIRLDVRDLSMLAATLANGCVCPLSGERVLPVSVVRDVLSVMHTCGMYDAAGQWAFDVGLPAKSGVSGGVMAVVPGKGGIGVWSPGLDSHGNSVRGVNVCREISERLGLHLLAAETEDAFVGAAAPRE